MDYLVIISRLAQNFVLYWGIAIVAKLMWYLFRKQDIGGMYDYVQKEKQFLIKMTVDKESFLTTNKQDYKWPAVKPLVPKPSQPPLKTKPLNAYVAKLVEPYCHCDAHLYEPEMGRYKKLAEKEKMLWQELDDLKKRMAILVSDILDHPCDTDDDKMETIYQTDYIKRGLNLVKYRKLMPAIDSPVGVPVKSESIGLGMGYRDPTRFRYFQIQTPFIDVCPPISFSRTPTLLDEWFAPRTGSTEYQDSYNKMGLSILKSSQQYAEPLPSSRRRADDPCLN